VGVACRSGSAEVAGAFGSSPIRLGWIGPGSPSVSVRILDYDYDYDYEYE